MKRKPRKHFVVCQESDIPSGGRLIVDLNGRSVGVFHVNGRFYALHNRCPHMGGALCEGPLAGTALPTDDRTFVYGREGLILRCGWHGWEFDIETGKTFVDPRMRARTYPVTVEDGNVIVHM